MLTRLFVKKKLDNSSRFLQARQDTLLNWAQALDMNRPPTIWVIAFFAIVITLRLLHAAFSTNAWKEFVISEFVVLVAAVCAERLLRSEEADPPNPPSPSA